MVNIFFTDWDPIVAARDSCDSYVVKIPVEVATMLSAIHWRTGYIGPVGSGLPLRFTDVTLPYQCPCQSCGAPLHPCKQQSNDFSPLQLGGETTGKVNQGECSEVASHKQVNVFPPEGVALLRKDDNEALLVQKRSNIIDNITLKNYNILKQRILPAVGPYRDSRVIKSTSKIYLWLIKSTGNYNYAIEYGLELIKQYKIRYKKYHLTEGVLLWLKNNIPNIPEGALTTDVGLSMPDKYKDIDNPTLSYKRYLIGEKSRIMKWKLGNIPDWYTSSLVTVQEGF